MNNRKIIYGALLLILVGVGWMLFRSGNELQPERSAREVTQELGITMLNKNKVSGEKRLSIIDGEGIEKPEGMLDADWQRALRVHSIKKSANRSVDFYGQVIDQYGEPIEGVRLKLKILSYQGSFIDYVKTGREQIKNRFTMMTDDDGMFSVEQEKGISFAIEKMTKEGYLSSGRGTKYNFVYSNLSSGEQSSMYHYPDKARPVVYKMWEKGETEPLIKTGTTLVIEPSKSINQTYYPFVLGGKPSVTPMPGWDIKVTGRNERSQDKRKPDEDYWEVTLTAGEGAGLVITDDPHGNLAPEDGYKKNLTFKSTDQAYPQSNLVHRAYFRGKNSEKYAAFRFELNFGGRKSKGMFYVRISDLRINPNGSRNLEYDKSKRIR